MTGSTLELVREELESVLCGRRVGRIFPLSRFSAAIDFRLKESLYLFFSIEPAAPRIYLIRRKLREIEKAAVNPNRFILFLRKRISGAEVTSVEKIPSERCVLLTLEADKESGETHFYKLVFQLTGRSANLFLLDRHGVILESARESQRPGQAVGDIYTAPARVGSEGTREEKIAERPLAGSISEELDRTYHTRQAEKNFQSMAGNARRQLAKEIARREKLLTALAGDAEAHGDADLWKRYAELLLANLATAERSDDSVKVVDYFDDSQPLVTISVDAEDSLTEAAEKYFKRYTKARNSAAEILRRRSEIESELAILHARSDDLEAAIAAGNEERVLEIAGLKRGDGRAKGPSRAAEPASGTRSFVSSDGFEILVGKKARDNDALTFRTAKSLDTWLHAADYPGSHVVIRNPNRKEIPHRTLIEAAQLAAFYSQAKGHPKAAVHYTQKKFVNKPRGSAPGLVSLSKFKTILVEPKVPPLEAAGGS